MKALGYILVGAACGIVGYFIGEQRKKISLGAKGSSSSLKKTGMGAAGVPRAGVPKTDAERLATHRAKYGISELPPPGTGLSRF